MRPQTRLHSSKPRPLSFSLARLSSAAAVAAALLAAGQSAKAQSFWYGSAPNGIPGDGFLWTNPNNWTFDTVPITSDALVFGDPAATPGTIILNGNQTADSLTFTDNFTLGAYGTSNVLTNTSGNITVTAGDFATINASYGGGNGINLSGGGTLFLNHPAPTFAGNIIVDGAGTTLLHRQEGPTVQYNGIGGAQEFGRFDQVTLGYTTATRTITLQNGGEYKIINTGNNSEGNYKNIVIGSGGGTLNLAAGYIVQNLDDVGQIGFTTEAFTKAGKGRLIITGLMADANPLGGIVNVNGGMLSLDRLQGAGAAGTRFAGIAAAGTTLNINSGGTLMINSGTQGRLDVPTVNLNDGGILAIQGNNHIIGLDAGTTTLNTSGTATLLTRDLFGPQTARFMFVRNTLTGAGTLNLIGNTASGATPRLVIERGSASTFSGTFRLVENTSLEANPRFNPTVNVGKVIADGDIEFAGWNGTLDVRDSNSAAASVFDYTTNEISVTTTQNGALNAISPGRGDGPTGTGHLFNFGTLTMGDHRLVIAGNNGYQTGFADTASIQGNAVILMNSDAGFAVFSNAAAISENAAGRSLTLLKTGVGSTAARDVIVGGNISLSNLQVATGTLQLRGANGAIGTAFGGAAPTITVNGSGLPGNGNTLPTQGLLNLDSNTGHIVGATTVFAAANNNDRIVDSATLNMRGNSILRLTSQNNGQTTETIGTTNVFGHATFDVVKTGTATAPVALTLSTLNMGTNATANFTGTSLGTAGVNTSRIVIPAQLAGFMGAQFHQANEWAKYDTTADNGFAIGVTPFVAADYAINTAETTWASGQHLKQNGATGVTLTANRNAATLNLQFSAANQSINTNGNTLSLEAGGILTSTNTAGITGAAGVGRLTAGTTAPASLFVHNNATLEIFVPITDNLGADLLPGGGDDSPVTFVKSGTGILVLSHHSRTVGQALVTNPFTAATWSSTNTGGWVINDGMLNVHRGQFLGSAPTTVTLNGGQLEINEPVSVANDATIIPGWGHNIVVNGNAMVGNDDNGEATDTSTGDRSMVKLGSLTINNGSLLGLGAFSDNDIAFTGGATINGKATINIATSRSGVNSAFIIGGVLAGSGFDLVGLGATPATLILGGTQSDTTNNTYGGVVTLYAGTVRLNKANGFTAITDGAAGEDVIINGGNLFMGPGQHGDLATTNQAGLTTAFPGVGSFAGTNNYGLLGIAPTSPAAIKNAGMNQIADTATITLLFGTLGEGDRITNEKFGTLIMKNGTFNVGLGTVEIDNATFSGGALGFDRGGTLRVGTASYLPGSFDQSVFTGRPGSPGAYTTLEIGAGGISLTGQNITLGNGFSGNVAGAGGRLRLGGNLSFTGSDLIGGSYGRKGIFVQTGSTFRELGASHIDLMGGTRDFNIATDSIYTITPRITNGGISKSGGGALVLEPYEPSSFSGPVVVNAGVLQAKGDRALGTGLIVVGGGGTIKLDSGWTYSNDFQVAGAGSIIPGSGSVREAGALIGESGTNRLNGSFTLLGDATIAGNTFLDPSVAPGPGGLAWRIGTLVIAGPGGVTGTGTLNLSGHGDGVILNGINTSAGGVTKDGAGRWTLSGPGTYSGATTISAGALRIADGAALGTTGAGTTVYGGGALELVGGIVVAEPLTISGDGNSIQSGALVNVRGNNTLTGAITLLGTTLRSDAGTLTVTGPITGGATAMTLTGAGTGVITGIITVGPAPSGDVLTKNGTGTWTLAATNVLSGSTAVNGGLLNIVSGGLALDAGSALNLGGGNVSVSGAAQAINGLNLLAGGGTVNGGVGLAAGAITRSAGATASFGGTITTSNANTNGILGGYATVGSDWATVNGSSNIVALTGASYVDLPFATATDNAIRPLFHLATGALNVNSLKIAGGSGVDLGANNLTLGSGGLLYSSPIAGGIGGTGIVSGPTSSDELIVHVTGSGTLDIAAPIIGAGTGSLTKAGPGTLVLSGTSSFTGSVNVNGGTLLIPGAPGFPGTLGASVVGGNRLINVNGGTFGILADWDINDWDGGTAGIQSFQINIGSAGGTLKTLFGAQLQINDGSTTAAGADQQLRGSGDLTFAGGGRLNLSGGTPQFLGFTGRTTVEGGILTVGHSNSLGGRQEQTITLKSGSAIINSTGFGLGQNGLPNNIVAEGGVEFFASGGNRVFGGDIQLSGTNTIGLFEMNVPGATNPINQERQVYFNGRVSGTGITLNVFGSNNGNPFYLASGSNPITGTINLNANAVMEVRGPGSLGVNTGDVTVNLNGANSRLFLRHWQNGDYRANVVVNETAEINSSQLTGFAGGGQQILSVNDLTFNGDNKILTIGGANTYHTRVGGTATFNAPTNTILNVTASDLMLDNGLTFGTPGSTLDKRGGFTAILRGPTNHTGKLVIQQGLVHLQDNGSLAGTTAIELRGGELRVDNSAVVNTNRINDAATISLGGGVLRLTGVETLGTISAVSGTTQVINNPIDETVPNPLTLTGFTRSLGAVVQFQSPDVGAGALAVGQNTFAQTRVGSRIFIPGQANTTRTIPGFVGNNNLDFIQYNGTTIDSGFALGVQDMRNPGNVNSPQNYTNDPAETAWNGTVIARLTNPTDNTTVTTTLTTNRALDAIKVETGQTSATVGARIREIALGAFQLRIEGGGILDVAATTHTFNVTGAGSLTAGPAVPGASTAELFLGGTGVMNINAAVVNNGTQSVALVKTGPGTVNLNAAAANTYTGGTYITGGTLNSTVVGAFGAAANAINLAGGTLQFNLANAATIGDLGVPDHPINVLANSTLILDNGALAGIDNDITLGPITINGPYTLSMRSFDSMDATFTGTHAISGTPTLDMAQATAGGNGTGFFTIIGGITGTSGFFVSSSGNVNDTTSILQIGAGEAVANTYTGKVTVLLGSNSEDLRVELNKAAGTTAITGDLEINGGIVRNILDNQIADTSNMVINQGSYDAFGKNETIASVTMRGGNFRTSSPATGGSTVTVTGNFEITGADDLTGSGDGVAVNSNTTLTIGGSLKMNGYSKGTVGASAAILNIGGLEMTGTTLTQNAGAGLNVTRLNGDVTTFASSNVARLGNSTDSDTFTELNGTRNFNVADGSAGIDLSLSSVVRDSTTPVAVGALVKNGNGVMQIEGGATGNSYTGGTTVNAGALVLVKNAGVTAIPAGTLTIGDGTGGAKADQVIVRNSNQIADTADVILAGSGLLDMDTFNSSETIANLTGAVGSAITLGPTSTLTVTSTGSTTYSGSIGDGTLTKAGAGTLYLDGSTELSIWNINVNAGTLNVDSNVNNAVVNVTGTANFGVDQLMTSLTINDGGLVTLGDLPGPPPSPFAGEEGVGADFGGAAIPVQGVPEPGSATLLFGGLLTILGLRRRR